MVKRLAGRVKPPDRRTGLTPEKREKFVTVLRETANVTGAARSISMSRTAVYERRKSDKAWADAWDNAIEEAVDALEHEARRRALAGVEKGIYYQGARVDTMREYSDVLTIFLLKAHRPEKYREKFEHSGPGGGPIPQTITVKLVRPKGSVDDGKDG